MLSTDKETCKIKYLQVQYLHKCIQAESKIRYVIFGILAEIRRQLHHEHWSQRIQMLQIIMKGTQRSF